jgi:hypothetical protein
VREHLARDVRWKHHTGLLSGHQHVVKVIEGFPPTREHGIAGFRQLTDLLFRLLSLLRLNHPLFASKQFHRATDDGFFIAIEARDPKFSPSATRDLLAEIGGESIELVEEEDN